MTDENVLDMYCSVVSKNNDTDTIDEDYSIFGQNGWMPVDKSDEDQDGPLEILISQNDVPGSGTYSLWSIVGLFEGLSIVFITL